MQNLVSLCLIANLIILGIVIYGTFYQDREQEMAIGKLQTSLTNITATDPGGNLEETATLDPADMPRLSVTEQMDDPGGTPSGDVYAVNPAPGETVTQPLPLTVKPGLGDDGVLYEQRGVSWPLSGWNIMDLSHKEEAITILEAKVAQYKEELGE